MLNPGAIGKPGITLHGQKTVKTAMGSKRSPISHQCSFAPQVHRLLSRPRTHKYFHINFTRLAQSPVEWQVCHLTPAIIYAYQSSHRLFAGQQNIRITAIMQCWHAKPMFARPRPSPPANNRP